MVSHVVSFDEIVADIARCLGMRPSAPPAQSGTLTLRVEGTAVPKLAK